jgi:hypothetical protein
MRIEFILLLALSRAVLAQPNPPRLEAFSFTPSSIDTTPGPVDVTVNFTIRSQSSATTHFEMTLLDPAGFPGPRVTALFASAPSTTGSRVFRFSQFSAPGQWKVGSIFLADSAGDTRILDTEAVAASGFPTTLSVSSTTDSVAPNLTGLRFEPASLDTTAGPAELTVQYEVTDDASGSNLLQLSFRSPSGTILRRTSAKLIPAKKVGGSTAVSFPQGSEPGTWTLASAFLSDVAGNTLGLDTSGLSARGFSTTLQVISRPDTTPPILTAFHFIPSSIDTSSGPATVEVDFAATDDFTGAKTFQMDFVSPSGTIQRGSADFAPSIIASGSTKITFPGMSEAGVWTVGLVLLADAAGNITVLDSEKMAAKGFVTALTIKSRNATPPR